MKVAKLLVAASLPLFLIASQKVVAQEKHP